MIRVFLVVLFQVCLVISSFGQSGSEVEQIADNPVQQAIVNKLLIDKIIEHKETTIYFFVLDDRILTNGSTLRGPVYQLYLQFLRTLQIDIEEHWGFYRNPQFGTFQGISDPKTVKKMVELFNNRSRVDGSLITITTQEAVRTLKDELVRRAIISDREEGIHLWYENDIITINNRIIMPKETLELRKFLKQIGIAIIKDPFELKIDAGKESWHLRGAFVSNLADDRR